MGAPTIRGQTAPVAGLSATSPAGTQIGDLVLVFTWERLGSGVSSTLTVQGGGYQELRNVFHNDGTTDGAFGIAAIVATSAGAQSYQGFTSSTGSPNAATGLSVLTKDTFDNQNGTLGALVFGIISSSQTGTTAPDPPNLTGLNPRREYLVYAVAAWHLSAAATVTVTHPTNYTNGVDISGSDDVELAFSSRAMPMGTTSEDPGTFADNVTPNGSVQCTLAIGGTLVPDLVVPPIRPAGRV